MNRLCAKEVRSLYSAALVAPFARVGNATLGTWMAAASVGVTEFLLGLDVFYLTWGLLFLITGTDYAIGSVRAKLEERFVDEISHAKLLGKAIGLGAVWFIYAGEVIARSHGVSTKSLIATSIAVLLGIEEMRSLNRHKKELTGRPIPGLGRFLDWLQAIALSRLSGNDTDKS